MVGLFLTLVPCTHQHRPVHPGPLPSRPYTHSGRIPQCWHSGRSCTCPESHIHRCLQIETRKNTSVYIYIKLYTFLFTILRGKKIKQIEINNWLKKMQPQLLKFQLWLQLRKRSVFSLFSHCVTIITITSMHHDKACMLKSVFMNVCVWCVCVCSVWVSWRTDRLRRETMRPQGPFRLHVSLMAAYISTFQPHSTLLFIYSVMT